MELEQTRPLVRLDLGAGQSPREGFAGVDLYAPDPQYRVDLFSFPWPWADGEVDELHCSHFVEHLPATTTPDGRDFLLALCLGYELGARIGAAASLRPGHHPHGTWGVVGAALAVARLSGADAAAIARTVNVASALSLATSMRTALEGGTVRNAYAGVANQLGLMAWEMAAAGFEGERDGVATVFGRISGQEFRPAMMTEALGTRWEVARNYFKLHACCRYNHAALDALEDIVARHGRVDPARVAAVEIETYGAAAELDGTAPRNALAARFSLPWASAAFLARGAADVPAFRAGMLGDATIAALARKVRVAEDKAMTARLPAERPARVRVVLADGAVLEATRASNRGDADDPYPRAAIEAKFMALATPAWGAAPIAWTRSRMRGARRRS